MNTTGNTQRYNIISFGKMYENLSISVSTGIIGSKLKTFGENVTKGSIVFLHCNGKIWGSGIVLGNAEESRERLWSNDIYPFRNRIRLEHLTLDPVVLSNGVYNAALRADYGVAWAYKFLFSPRPLPEKIGREIYDDLLRSERVHQGAFLEKIKALSVR